MQDSAQCCGHEPISCAKLVLFVTQQNAVEIFISAGTKVRGLANDQYPVQAIPDGGKVQEPCASIMKKIARSEMVDVHIGCRRSRRAQTGNSSRSAGARHKQLQGPCRGRFHGRDVEADPLQTGANPGEGGACGSLPSGLRVRVEQAAHPVQPRDRPAMAILCRLLKCGLGTLSRLRSIARTCDSGLHVPNLGLQVLNDLLSLRGFA